MGKQSLTLFFGAPKSLQMVTATMKSKDAYSLEGKLWPRQPRQHNKKQRHYFTNKDLSSQGYGFSSSHVWMWELDYKESWASKNWCFWTVVLEKTLESPLDCKEIQPVHPKGKAEHRRIDAFELWCWRRLLRVPWTARRSNQSILKEISSGCSLEGLMLKLKLPILWPHDAKNWLIWKDPDAGKDWGQAEKGTTEDKMVGWHHRLNGREFG